MHGPGFVGFGLGALRWFEGLAANDAKTRFEAHRGPFEAEIRAPLAAFVDEVAARRGGTAQLFRQHRDARFSKDKSSCETSTHGVVAREGALPLCIAISPGGCRSARD